jgi:hypothetical protein
MSARDVYFELLMIFIISFLILYFSRSVGEQLVFMLIAFILSSVLGELFIGGVKGLVKHPIIAQGKGAATKEERLHEKRYVFLLFFIFILGSTILGGLLSTYIVNSVLYPSIGSLQGGIIVSGMITLVLYVTMLWLFDEKLINRTSIGLIIILIILMGLFVFFSGYTNVLINYFAPSFSLLTQYAGKLGV